MNLDRNSAFEAVLANHRAESEVKTARDNPVIGVFDSIAEYVKAFEEDLVEDEEVGAKLVSFGGSQTLHVRQISYSLPSLIVFTGTNDAGEKTQLIQHISQLNFLLVAVKKVGERAPYRVGFV